MNVLKRKKIIEIEAKVYTINIYFCFKKMKTLSLKLDDHIFEETEEITAKMKLARNRYINEALKIFNLYNKKKLFKQQLTHESKLVSKESMKILEEFEQFINED